METFHLDKTTNIDTLSLTDGFTIFGDTLNTSGSGSPTILKKHYSRFTFKGTDSSDLLYINK